MSRQSLGLPKLAATGGFPGSPSTMVHVATGIHTGFRRNCDFQLLENAMTFVFRRKGTEILTQMKFSVISLSWRPASSGKRHGGRLALLPNNEYEGENIVSVREFCLILRSSSQTLDSNKKTKLNSKWNFLQ